jgi:glutamine amidotransferase
MKTLILDLDIGNLGSLKNSIKKITKDVCISNDKNDIEQADKLIISGVGNFGTAMKNLRSLKIEDLISKRIIEDKTPVLGICLGMQMFFESSEESDQKGLNWLEGECKEFKFIREIINHPNMQMGWNNIEPLKNNSILNGIQKNSRFYFAHKYYVKVGNQNDIVAKTNYGFDFTSIVNKANIFGVQFHPEKSSLSGRKILENFINV